MIRRYWLIAIIILQLTNKEASAQLLPNIEIINASIQHIFY